jgi:hypothetical protein
MATRKPNWGTWTPNSPFYNVNGTYGGKWDWLGSNEVRMMDRGVPEGVFESFLANKGLGGFDARSQFARSLYGRLQTGYDAAKRRNMGLSFEQYLNRQLPGNRIESLWRGLSPSQRNENPSLYAPRVRLIRRG